MKILHLTPDEKFISTTQRIYEAAFPGCNRYVVLRRGGGKAAFVAPGPNVRHVAKTYWFSSHLDRDLADCDCLIVHYMNPWFARAIRRARRETLVVWSGWGADYYELLKDYRGAMLLPQTLALTQANGEASLSWLKARSKHHAAELSKRIIFGNWGPPTFARIDVVSVYPDEFPLLQASLPELRAKFHQLYYFSVEDVFAKGPPEMDGPDILLGNSANPTNNHLEALDLLERLDLDGRRIIAPLSYGGQQYGDHIAAEGRRRFGQRFQALRDYMPIDEYNALIASCGYVAMNHVRQQAVGNVSTAIYKGAKVFLRRENLVNPFYRHMGVTVHDMPEQMPRSDEFFRPLTTEQRQTNKARLDEFWSFDALVTKTAELAKFARA